MNMDYQEQKKYTREVAIYIYIYIYIKIIPCYLTKEEEKNIEKKIFFAIRLL